MADTAEPGSGKSPAVDPIVNVLFDVLSSMPDLAPGTPVNRLHMQERTTHSFAFDRLRVADGYLFVASGEAGPLLCASLATNMTWNQTSHMNLQKFLDSANGSRFMWGTMFDRTLQKQDATDSDAATGISFTKTNVTFALFQQLSVFCRWWALAEHRQPIGLAARFLFG